MEVRIIRKCGYTDPQLLAFAATEETMRQQDALAVEAQAARNDLEACIYSTRRALSEHLNPFVSEEDAGELATMLSEAEAWLYADGFDASAESSRLQHSALKSAVDPIANREHEARHRPAGIASLEKTIFKYQKLLSTAVCVTVLACCLVPSTLSCPMFV
jgi:molecular chaperone DnaK (HSP70)